MKKKQEGEGSVNRKPPAEIRRRLRKEVGFGCPVPGCGNPYLYWHHFDPPWEPNHVHNEAGMIALCGEHHAKADARAFTDDQLREYKTNGKRLREEAVSGQFDWLRHSLLAVVGGNFYYETPIVFQVRDQLSIWFTRDKDNYMGLNIIMLSNSSEDRIVMEENYWILKGEPDDFECPPGGRKIHARYANGDELRIEFFEILTEQDASNRYPIRRNKWEGVDFPITAVEVCNRIDGTIEGRQISFDKKSSTIGNAIFQGCLLDRCVRAIWVR